MRQIEQMESEELMTQKKLRTEVIQLEDMLAQVRKEYEMLRIEFEQNLAANEQTGPINKEMRDLIQSIQTHNVQLKNEVCRYKRKCKEANLEIGKLRKDLEEMKTAEIKALQIKRENSKSHAPTSGSGDGNAGSESDVTTNNASDGTNSQDESSSPVHNHENNHSDTSRNAAGNNGNSVDGSAAEMSDETSNGPLKVCRRQYLQCCQTCTIFLFFLSNSLTVNPVLMGKMMHQKLLWSKRNPLTNL